MRRWSSPLATGCLVALCMAGMLFCAGSVHAHKASDSYLTLAPEGRTIAVQWDIALRDLDYAIGLDANDDGAITWGELQASEQRVLAYALARLQLSAGNTPCVMGPAALLVDRHTDGAYAVLRFNSQCNEAVAAFTADYRLFFDLDPMHRGLTSVRTAGGAGTTAIFSPEQPRQTLAVTAATPMGQLFAFIREGIWHIWIGVDHLLFLVALLLPSTFYRSGKRWVPVADLRDALWSVVRIVTAFTVAHSITLSLAALQWVSLPSRWVETAIALSVLLAALNNLWPIVRHRLWAVAFGFGLIHGFGFASVLLDLDLGTGSLMRSLLGFNIGVELGQLAVVGACFLLVILLRRTALHSHALVTTGSALTAAVAITWMLERGLELKLFPS